MIGRECDLSVVVAVRDGEKTILDALNSVINQDAGIGTFISVVNDCSVDDTSKKVLAFYKDLGENIGFSYKTLDASVGPGEARNIAESLTPASKYLAFIDADDVWLPSHISSKINKLELENGDIAYGGMRDVLVKLENNEIIEQDIGLRLMFQPEEAFYHPGIVSGFEKYFLVNRCNITIPSTVVMRKGLFRLAGGFPRRILCGEDGVLWRRLAEANRKFVYDSNITIKYRSLSPEIGWNQSSSLKMPHSGGRHLIGKEPFINGRELDEDWKKEMKAIFGDDWYEKLEKFDK